MCHPYIAVLMHSLIINKSQEMTIFSGRQKLTSAMELFGQKSDDSLQIFYALYR